MGPSGHFTRMWTRCGHCKMLGHVELPVQRRLCPIFVSGVGLSDIHEYSANSRVVNETPRDLGRHKPSSMSCLTERKL